MATILDEIIKELNTLPEVKQEKAYQFILALKTDQNYLNDKTDDEKLKEGYQYLADEHLMLCEQYGGNDEVLS